MLTVETIGRSRRERLLKGKSIKEIARDLKVSRNTVRKVLRSGATAFEYEREVQPRPKLGRWMSDLEDLLLANATKPAREHLHILMFFSRRRHWFHSRIGDWFQLWFHFLRVVGDGRA